MLEEAFVLSSLKRILLKKHLLVWALIFDYKIIGIYTTLELAKSQFPDQPNVKIIKMSLENVPDDMILNIDTQFSKF